MHGWPLPSKQQVAIKKSKTRGGSVWLLLVQRRTISAAGSRFKLQNRSPSGDSSKRGEIGIGATAEWIPKMPNMDQVTA